MRYEFLVKSYCNLKYFYDGLLLRTRTKSCFSSCGMSFSYKVFSIHLFDPPSLNLSINLLVQPSNCPSSVHLSIHLSALLLNHQQNEKHSISSPHGSMDGFKDGGQTGEWTEPWVKWQVCAKHLLGQGEVGWCRRDKLSETMLGKKGYILGGVLGCFRAVIVPYGIMDAC